MAAVQGLTDRVGQRLTGSLSALRDPNYDLTVIEALIRRRYFLAVTE